MPYMKHLLERLEKWIHRQGEGLGKPAENGHGQPQPQIVRLHKSPAASSCSPGAVRTVLKLQVLGVYHTLCLVFAFRGCLHHRNEEMRESKISDRLTICIAQN